jgi:NAD(P)-dependent dehydrogenase (short-subunit alcohol dehydrogenase family)
MKRPKIVVVGASSDLIQPFLHLCVDNQIETCRLTTSDWDLRSPIPSHQILDRLISFRPNHLVFAAGINSLVRTDTDPAITIDMIQQHLAVNCLSFVSLVLHLINLPEISLNSIHVISSLYGVYGRRFRLPYSISKHALEGAIKCLAIELPRTQVIGYRPGFFDTKLTRGNLSRETLAQLQQRIPAHRLGSPDEISSLIFHHILNPIPYLTGVCFSIDGGLSSGGIFD